MARFYPAGGAGGGVSSDELVATAAHVLSGHSYVGSDTNDEIGVGTMPNYGGQSKGTDSVYISGDYMHATVKYPGYYDGSSTIQMGKTNFGTATQAQVLKDQTFTSSNGINMAGTMPNNGAVSPAALGAGGSYTIPAGYHNGSGKVTVQSLATLTASGDATAAQILTGKKAYVDGSLITGTMADQGAKTSSLNCGGSYTIPAGYHNGSGKITANSLSSQTDATATAAYIRSGYTAWVKGSKLTGTMAVTSAINFSATAQSATVIRISWTNPSKGPWEGVEIRMSTSSSPGVSGGTQKYKGKGSSGTAGGSSYVDITGLTPGTTHYFTCTSYATGLGNGSSYNVSAKTSGFLIYSYGTAIGTVTDGTIYDKGTVNSDNLHLAKYNHDTSGYYAIGALGNYNFGIDVAGKATLTSLDSYSNIVFETKPVSYPRGSSVGSYSLGFRWKYYDSDGYVDYAYIFESDAGASSTASLGSVQTIKVPFDTGNYSCKKYYNDWYKKYGYPDVIAIGGNWTTTSSNTYWGEYYIYRVYLE